MIFDSLVEHRQSPENPSTSLSNPDLWLWDAFGASRTVAGTRVNERTALKLSAVWAAIHILAETLGQLPLSLIRKDGSDKEQARDDPRFSLLHDQPNTEMTSINWRSTVQAHVVTTGNGYNWIMRNQAGLPIELIPLMPHVTSLKRENGRLVYHSRTNVDGRDITFRLNPADVLHIPGLGFDGLSGYSPIRMQAEQLGAGLATQEFAARFFGNGANISGLVTVPGKVQDLSKMRKEWNAAFAGENQMKTAIVDQGAGYTRIGIPPEDAQFLQTREFSIDEVARMYRIPPHMLARMGQATFSNVEHVGIDFVTYTMLPWLTRWEQELNRKLLTIEERQTMFFKFNVTGLLRGDQKTRYESYRSAIQVGWMTRNEARTLEEFNEIDGLDEPLQPMNMTTVGGDGDNPDNEPRLMLVVRKAARNLVVKETNALKRICKTFTVQFSRNIPDVNHPIHRQVGEFYAKHQDHMVDVLGCPPAFAAQYCAAHRRQFMTDCSADNLFTDWLDNHADALATIIWNGGYDETD